MGKSNINKTSKVSVENPRLLIAYRQMLRARKIDEKAIVLYKQNKCHFQIGCAGHEAIQVAAAMSMNPGYDWAYPYYRDMAFVASWGMTSREFFLNIMNKAADPNSGGRQMPMHYGHKALNIVSQSSPTGTQFLQAVGAAKAAVYRDSDQVVYVSSGEGTTAQGSYFEAINWAAREKLPVVFVVQDNEYAISVHISEQFAGKSVANLARAFIGLDVVEVDGLDFHASSEVMKNSVGRARVGDGPTLVVAKVVRLQSHSISDNQAKYRTAEELAEDKAKDPIRRLETVLIESGICSAEQLLEIQKELAKEIDEAATWAEEQADPSPNSAAEFVYIDPKPQLATKEAIPNGEDVFLVDALNLALDEEMARDPDMVIYGQDVAYGKGGVFSVTAGLTKKYGAKRVFNSPLAEASIIGTAVGLATVGLRPVVEIQFGDYCWTAMMDLRNELALMAYRSNGQFHCPAVVRIPVGGYINGGLYHSQNIEATFSHFPGLYVVLPSNAWDAKGLLKSAIRGPDPVIFLEHKGLYRQVYAKAPRGGAEDLIPLGKAKVIKEGSDATVVTWGALVNKTLTATENLRKKNNFSVEVIDLRTILPLDEETILKSVRKTGRLLVAHEDVLFMGFGAEIAAMVSENAFVDLDAPVARVGGRFAPIPHAQILEKEILPQIEDIESALTKLLLY